MQDTVAPDTCETTHFQTVLVVYQCYLDNSIDHADSHPSSSLRSMCRARTVPDRNMKARDHSLVVIQPGETPSPKHLE